jgi:hypothetical protein
MQQANFGAKMDDRIYGLTGEEAAVFSSFTGRRKKADRRANPTSFRYIARSSQSISRITVA